MIKESIWRVVRAAVIVGFIVLSGGILHPALAAGERLLVLSGIFDRSVLEFNGTTGVFNKVLVDPINGGLFRSRDLTFGPDGNIYVSSLVPDQSRSVGVVKRYDGLTGAFIDDFSQTGVMRDPRQLLFGPDGNLYVSEPGCITGGCDMLGHIYRFNGKTGEYIDTFVADYRLHDLVTFTFGRDGNLYISTRCCDSEGVLRYSGATGAFMDTFTNGGPPRSLPTSLVFGPNGDLYAGVIQGIDRYEGTSGTFIDSFVPRGSHGLTDIGDLIFRPDNNLYVVDGFRNAILRFNGLTGDFIDTFASFASIPGSFPYAAVFSPPASASSCDGNAATIVGTDGDDIIYGTPGNDVIMGLGGNDIVSGLGGNDIICGGPGQDSLIGGPGDDRIFGGAGDDLLYGGESSDDLFGGDGNDRLLGGAGSDRLSGEESDDTLDGGVGNDRLDGGAGKDNLQGGQGDDTLLGQEGDDVLSGGVGSDVMMGGPGRDTLRGGSGDDRLSGEEGDDVLSGGDGTDQLSGGAGNDSLFGDGGDDIEHGDEGKDVCDGGTGIKHADSSCEKIS